MKINDRVDVVVRNSSVTESVTIKTQRIKPPSSTVNNSGYANQVYQKHDRSGVTPGNKVKALPYRVFAGRFYPNDFDYTYGNNTTQYRRWGKTPIALSVGAAISVEYGTKLSGGLRVPDVPINLENRAVTEALNKLQDSKMDLWVSIAESRKTVDFIATTIGRILRSYKAARRGDFRAAYRIISGSKPGKSANYDPSGGWLAYNYGVLPLMYDVQGAFQLLEQGLKDQPVIVAKRFVSQPYPLPNKPLSWVAWQCDGKIDVGVEVCLKAAVADPMMNLLNQMGLYNPFSTAWELIPFSFVIDWVIPIGNALEALTASIGIRFLDGYINHKLRSKFTWAGANVLPIAGNLPGGTVRTVCQWRRTYLDFPLPRLYIRSPFRTKNVISALALISQLRR